VAGGGSTGAAATGGGSTGAAAIGGGAPRISSAATPTRAARTRAVRGAWIFLGRVMRDVAAGFLPLGF
jgi:hypothetical protein